MGRTELVLKILLPAYESSEKDDTFDRVYKEIRKAGMPYSLLVAVDRDHRVGELPARNQLFRMALQDPNWNLCVTLSNDIFELPKDWASKLVEHISEMPRDVGALNAYGFVNTTNPDIWSQVLIGKDGEHVSEYWVGDNFNFSPYLNITPPNPELSTACCIIKREVLETVGLFDEGFGRGGGMEHWDYVIRMYRAGFQNLLTYKVRFKADIARGNNFTPNDTYTYYHKKWGTGLDGLPTKLFIEKAKHTSPSAGF